MGVNVSTAMTRMAGTMSRCDDIRDEMASRERKQVDPAQMPCYLLSGCFDGKYLDSETSLSRQKELEAGIGGGGVDSCWQVTGPLS